MGPTARRARAWEDGDVDELFTEPDIVTFYQTRYLEDDRLRVSSHGRLEFLRTQELLRRYLPEPLARVLDVGGATGVHASWLAEDGYTVHVVDLVPEHVEQAATLGGGITAAVGDARSLEEPDATADVVLLLGPLYHLIDGEDRLTALREAHRVVRPGGLVAAAGVCRYLGMLDAGARGQLDDPTMPLLRDVLDTGLHDPRLGFTTAYFHHPEELGDEFRSAGFSDVEVYGVEGPMWIALDALGVEHLDDLLPSALACARALERDRAMIATSAHLLALARG